MRIHQNVTLVVCSHLIIKTFDNSLWVECKKKKSNVNPPKISYEIMWDCVNKIVLLEKEKQREK